MRRRIATASLLVVIPWTLVWLWSWWTAGSNGVEEFYYSIRDRLQPRGYAINGPLRYDLAWSALHLSLIGPPWVLFRLVRGRRSPPAETP